MITNPGTFNPYNPTPAGQTFHGDHAYVFYQIPAESPQISVGDVAWHRAVFQNMGNHTRRAGRISEHFSAQGFPVYLIDQPRRGNAGRSTVAGTITPTPDEQGWFGTFRIGIWPDYFEGVQFSRDSETLNQYFPPDGAQYRTN